MFLDRGSKDIEKIISAKRWSQWIVSKLSQGPSCDRIAGTSGDSLIGKHQKDYCSGKVFAYYTLLEKEVEEQMVM